MFLPDYIESYMLTPAVRAKRTSFSGRRHRARRRCLRSGRELVSDRVLGLASDQELVSGPALAMVSAMVSACRRRWSCRR